ncbi:transposase [Streptomyces angustmyceticus]|uniref:transposase n=1 Tax=Streptomyces angustmyceticus TaxID=285578 RepID=UPI003D8F88E4
MAGSPAGDRRDRIKYRTGCSWMDLPAEFGSWEGTHNRLRKWAGRRHTGTDLHRAPVPGRRRR